ncbi:YifB family Mg chelatase-like AAA ATPase [Rhodomicrobium sp.]|uniref:YifB family Mg chelatase-like AAA ATPase n=1 Tax=Rhodomicrobium sp. TaxID=2720632 RepID=UPI0039E3B044
MFAQVSTVTFEGIDAKRVDVQVLIAPGLPSFSIVGLPDKSVGESRERVRAALTAIGLGLPAKRITVNLAPADMPKEGTHYDLPIALGVMAAAGAIPGDLLKDFIVIGELGLDGSLGPIAGALPAAFGASGLDKGLICPAASGPEAAWASADMPIVAPAHLTQLVNHLKGTSALARPRPYLERGAGSSSDLKDVRGQESAKRALEVAAAGGHHMLMIGPPGAGKSMLAQRLPGILPPLEPHELLEVAMVQSIAGTIVNGALTATRPFRAPHHSASMAALVGGGAKPKPGEVALAHHGVLFLDELPEFPPHVLDALRQPIESGETIIARVNHRIRYPSRFQLVAAMNPCRCGHAWTPGMTCKLGPRCEESYRGRISGPLWDRIDIQIPVAPVKATDLALPPAPEGSREVAARVAAARSIQIKRYSIIGNDAIAINGDCPAALLDDFCALSREGLALLEKAADVAGLSARGYHRTLRLARTVADLDASAGVHAIHVAEALSLRGEVAAARRAAAA